MVSENDSYISRQYIENNNNAKLKIKVETEFYMTILVIGNGFDLAHHLPTQYSDFLDFVKAFINPHSSDNMKLITSIKESNASLYSEIKDLIEDNVLLNYFLSIYEEKCQKGENGWIDFESEISLVVRKLDEAKQYIASQVKGPEDYAKLDKGIYQYLKYFISEKKDFDTSNVDYAFQPLYFDNKANCIFDSLNRLTRLLEIYLYECVEKTKCEYRILDLDGINVDYVLSFNYTDTYRKYYDSNDRAQYCYIHGKVKESNLETCNLILGIDEYLPTERIDLDNDFVWFKKFYQRIYKGTGSEYWDWIANYERFNGLYKKTNLDHLDLYIYGHSLDVTDKDVLSRLILIENSTTHIFYYSRDAYAKQISNLVKIVGEDNLIRMTGGRDRGIRFIQSQPAVRIKESIESKKSC